MKRLLIFAVLVIMLILLNSCSKSTSHKDLTSWTYVFYNDADCTNMYDPMEDFAAFAFAGDNLQILVLQDTYEDQTKLWQIDSEHNAVLLQEMGELNMGDPQTLYNLLIYAAENCPADKYILSLYDHGGSWEGSCWDDTSGGDNLTLDEMQQALTSFGSVEMIMFTAPCFMGCLEAAYEFKDLCEVFIASENWSGYILWEEAIDDICLEINNDPEIESIQLSEIIISKVEDFCLEWEIPVYTLSAIDTNKLDNLASALDELCIAYLDDDSDFLPIWLEFNINIQSYGFAGYNVNKDICDFAQVFLEHETDEEIIIKLESLQAALTDCVIANYFGSENPRSHGLSMFFKGFYPFNSGVYPDPDYGLDICKDTHLDELHTHYFQYSVDGPSTRELMIDYDGYK